MECIYSSYLPVGAKLKVDDYLIIGVDNEDERRIICESEHRGASQRRIFDKRPKTEIGGIFKKPRMGSA